MLTIILVLTVILIGSLLGLGALTGRAALALFDGYEGIPNVALTVYRAFTFLINEAFGKTSFPLANRFALD